jgi:multiple sugar transport system substrate-binding protein
MFSNIDAQARAGNPPDVFRVPYGSYAGRGQLLDLSDRLDASFGDRFTPEWLTGHLRASKPRGGTE